MSIERVEQRLRELGRQKVELDNEITRLRLRLDGLKEEYEQKSAAELAPALALKWSVQGMTAGQIADKLRAEYNFVRSEAAVRKMIQRAREQAERRTAYRNN